MNKTAIKLNRIRGEKETIKVVKKIAPGMYWNLIVVGGNTGTVILDSLDEIPKGNRVSVRIDNVSKLKRVLKGCDNDRFRNITKGMKDALNEVGMPKDIIECYMMNFL